MDTTGFEPCTFFHVLEVTLLLLSLFSELEDLKRIFSLTLVRDFVFSFSLLTANTRATSSRMTAWKYSSLAMEGTLTLWLHLLSTTACMNSNSFLSQWKIGERAAVHFRGAAEVCGGQRDSDSQRIPCSYAGSHGKESGGGVMSAMVMCSDCVVKL